VYIKVWEMIFFICNFALFVLVPNAPKNRL